MAAPAPETPLSRGWIKEVLSGDSVVIRGQPRNGPPPERRLSLAGITAPKLGRRPFPGRKAPAPAANGEGGSDAAAAPTAEKDKPAEGPTPDEPFAWQSREFLRKLLVGKPVEFVVEYKVPSGREFGHVYVNVPGRGRVSAAFSLLQAGQAKLREGGRDPPHPDLLAAASDAEAAGRGVHQTPVPPGAIRDVAWTVADPRALVTKAKGKPVPAIIENVRDGCCVRAFLLGLPKYQYVTVLFSGVKSPSVGGGDREPEPYALEAKYFTESRLLQREVRIVLEGVDSRDQLLGTVQHPAGLITEFLVSAGFAKVVDWSIGQYSGDRAKLRALMKTAQKSNQKIWKDWQPNEAASIPSDQKNFKATVVEIVSPECMVVDQKGQERRKIFLSSFRNPPRPQQPEGGSRGRGSMYDTPYMFEAREFLRKRLVGTKVDVTVDYIKPANEGYPEKTCCTIVNGGVNMAVALVSKGYGTPLRHRQDDDDRSPMYDELMAAEVKAQKGKKGIHDLANYTPVKFNDMSTSKENATRFFDMSLSRSGKKTGIVDFVSSGSRLKLMMPKDNCTMTVLLAGISCPRSASRDGTGGEPFGQEALDFTRNMCLQREVDFECESVDKNGGFVGHVYFKGTNLALALVEEGLAKMHFSADRYSNYDAIYTADEQARKDRRGVWANYEEPKEEEAAEEEAGATTGTPSQKVLVSHVSGCDEFYYQDAAEAATEGLRSLSESLNEALTETPPTVGAFAAKRGALCAAKFSFDNMWYRAKITECSESGTGMTEVIYVDYGNSAKVDAKDLAALPESCSGAEPYARLAKLAFTSRPDEDWQEEAREFLAGGVLNLKFEMSRAYTEEGTPCVTLVSEEDGGDIIDSMISNGLLFAQTRREEKFKSQSEKYSESQEIAMEERNNMWRYGDCRPELAKEFGMNSGK